ncbi:MAG: nuclear transport factor 2 family protein [Candidatus Aminicenantes bacterium]|nr:MAG: nuclear transport factor 2 family protein [Candidatus Aminicenantes bacterium]
MAFDIEQKAREEIRELLSNISKAWTKGHPEELEGFFHEEMVITGPGFKGGGRGKSECVKSYKDFITHATIREVKESEHMIDVWGSTAVASYRFEIDYEVGGERHNDAGHDLFVFAREGGKWLAVWRTIIPLSQGE